MGPLGVSSMNRIVELTCTRKFPMALTEYQSKVFLEWGLGSDSLSDKPNLKNILGVLGN